jgi:pimeloyl-ACP methyl ester carboxylesterase
MKYQLKVDYTWTKDELRLQGMHYEPEKKDVGVVFIHGMGGNFIEEVYANVLGTTLAENGYGLVYGHNRGYSQINDIAKKSRKADNGFEYTRNGSIYERFQNCPDDIEAWLDEARQLGYRRLVIAGGSLGCTKLIYAWHKHRPEKVIGVVLASPADMVGLVLNPGYQPNYQELLKEAKQCTARGEFSKLLSGLVWNWYPISAQTFLDIFTENGPADVFPVFRNPPKWEQFASIDVPMLCLLGEYDDAVIRSIKEDLELIKTKATGCPDFQTAVIAGANHTYENREKEFADPILKWLKLLKIMSK